MIYLLIALLVYLILAALVYGLTFAHFQREYPDLASMQVSNDRTFALLLAMLAPLSCWVVFYHCAQSKHGLMYRAARR